MKKILIHPLFGISLLTLSLPEIHSQERIVTSVQFGRPCGMGRGLCSVEEAIELENVAIANQNNLFSDGLNRVNLKIMKYSLTKEVEEQEFKNHYLYFIEDEFQLLKERNQGKPMIIARGAHPIIELEDSYVISFTLKNNF
ncbi:MAG: hypothetical protein ACOYOA_05520 [Saprospiraceae bacterium]